MVIMPDGAKFKMNWKYITYVNHGNSIHFSIVPMYNGPDIVLFPNMENWEKDGAFSLEEREEIIFLLEHLNWKRNLKIVEANVPAQKSEKAFVQKGSLETTNAYAALARKNLFDFDSKLDTKQVKDVYLALEKRFAENVRGTVTISQYDLFENSVMKEFIMPILQKNKDAAVHII